MFKRAATSRALKRTSLLISFTQHAAACWWWMGLITSPRFVVIADLALSRWLGWNEKFVWELSTSSHDCLFSLKARLLVPLLPKKIHFSFLFVLRMVGLPPARRDAAGAETRRWLSFLRNHPPFIKFRPRDSVLWIDRRESHTLPCPPQQNQFKVL